ncbi:MAG: M23 family metallopeptidase [Ekhidna sp.]|nr:M23 family metallopeptidase [Ekhidna sp.]MBC6409234.1 M23 family metallopeptidase [Ekhidna sp.]MBC6425002.1 M23 family metallopeptidase [Ekhidna sp.]
MAARRTFSNWLTNKYLLIIRNEENFAEKTTLSFNYARLLLLLSIAFLIILGIAVYLVTLALDQWLDPRHTQMVVNRQVVELTMKIDSLEQEVKNKNIYFENVRKIIAGEEIGQPQEDYPEAEIKTSELSETLQPIDSQFRASFEESELSDVTALPITVSSSTYEFRDLYLFSPIDGYDVTAGFDPKTNHFGIDIVAKEDEPIRSVADGVVIMSSWTLDGGYIIAIQHSGNLISVYKHNSELFKNVGNFVVAGEVIATIGNTGELTSGPHLHLELWHEGNPVNPHEYIAL